MSDNLAQGQQQCPLCNTINTTAQASSCSVCGRMFDIAPAAAAPPPPLSRTIPLPPQLSERPPQEQMYVSGPVMERPLPAQAANRQSARTTGGTIQLPAGTHSTGLAVFLAALITGAGQMANKQVAKGITLLLASILVNFVVPFGGAIVWIIAFVDAIHVAARLNRGEPVGDWQFF